MNAEERLAQLTAGDQRRQARRRSALREKGMTQQNVWVPAELRDLIDQQIADGRFSNRSEAISWALQKAFIESAA